MLSFEVLLFIGAIGFYLYDSKLLLYSNEVVFIRNSKKWMFICPGNNWLFLGKSPYIPNPLTPGSAIFRLYWSEKPRSAEIDVLSIEEFISALRPVRYLVNFLIMQFVIPLPLILFLYGSGPQLLIIFGTIYLNIVLILILVFINKNHLGITNKFFITLMYESIVCAPYALNIVRKITLKRPPKGDPIQFAKLSFDKETLQKLAKSTKQKIDHQLEFLDANSSRYTSLEAYKTKIKEYCL